MTAPEPTRPTAEHIDAVARECGCIDLSDHVAPHVDPVLHIAHGERDDCDPEPRDVPGTGGWNGLYTASPDKFCLCGHPNYATCQAWPSGGVMGLTMHSVGGHYLTTTGEVAP